ncbi:alcohol dehydrogenase, putative [Babesia caballi]|uniref:Alcohol dehydrogenase, putative n=1 Tax=Babesia caballi TaxID=5871 RepID=A0AAV4LVL3_BABCB|nr:alcohol dehydrogenase, putative [Babesia caballi]
MTATKWEFSSEDAVFSLIHIKSPDSLGYGPALADPVNTPHNNHIGFIQDDILQGNDPRHAPIRVVQGATLSIGVLVRPSGTVESLETWKSKYSDLEVNVQMPSHDDDTDFFDPPRFDSLAADAPAVKNTLVGDDSGVYILHTTMNTLGKLASRRC